MHLSLVNQIEMVLITCYGRSWLGIYIRSHFVLCAITLIMLGYSLYVRLSLTSLTVSLVSLTMMLICVHFGKASNVRGVDLIREVIASTSLFLCFCAQKACQVGIAWRNLMTGYETALWDGCAELCRSIREISNARTRYFTFDSNYHLRIEKLMTSFPSRRFALRTTFSPVSVHKMSICGMIYTLHPILMEIKENLITLLAPIDLWDFAPQEISL